MKFESWKLAIFGWFLSCVGFGMFTISEYYSAFIVGLGAGIIFGASSVKKEAED